jgi:prephenate dehydratase
MKVGYLGPAGTFSHEALMDAPGAGAWELAPLPTIYDTVIAVHERRVDRALVPIENSLEGSVNATLDALALETDDLVIVGERVHAIRYCLLAGAPVALDAIRTVISHPQASAQCARFIRTRLAGAEVVAASSTAEAARMVAEGELDEARGPWAALGNRLAAELYGCEVLLAGVEDVADNETRFVWIAPAERPTGGEHGPWKTALVFWGVGDEAPGWLVRCLAEFSTRGVNLTRIESRPRKQGLGRYMFFVDLEGHARDAPVAEAVAALRVHAETVRVLGSFTAA